MRDVRWRALVAACLLGSVACDGGSRVGRLNFEVAAPSSSHCEVGAPTPTLGPNQPCTVLRLYRRDSSGGLTPVPLFRTDGDHGDSAEGAAELRFEDRKVAFDAMLEEDTAHDLFLTAYTGDHWDTHYGAHLEDVRLEDGDVQVRLYPLRTWSCPGPSSAEDERPAPRALHAAVKVGNGDVLLLGGVNGTDIDPEGAGRDGRIGALLQSIQEVYDPRTHRFRRLTMVDGGRFARVLFDVIDLGEDGPNRYRLRAIGGFELPDESAGGAVLEFDRGGALSTFGPPFVPSAMARAAAVVDLVYDAEELTLEVLPPADDPFESRAAGIRISEPLANGERVMLMGFAKGAMGWVPSTSYYVLNGDTVKRHTLLHQRLGASIVPVLDRFLVWGGNVDPAQPRVMEYAGELIVPDASGTALAAAPGGLPRPTAFHTATSFEDGLVLITGGVSVADTGNLFEVPTEDPIFALQVMADGSVLLRDVVDEGYTPTMLHTATRVPGWGVVITGGAALATGEDRLMPLSTVGRVPSNPLVYDGALPKLAVARFGHRATLLDGNRLLVTGGFTRSDANRLDAIGLAELIYLAYAPYPSIPAGACIDQRSLPQQPVDAGPPDAGSDGGTLPVMDGGGLPDGG